jgi:hypothetical protein
LTARQDWDRVADSLGGLALKLKLHFEEASGGAAEETRSALAALSEGVEAAFDGLRAAIVDPAMKQDVRDVAAVFATRWATRSRSSVPSCDTPGTSSTPAHDTRSRLERRARLVFPRPTSEVSTGGRQFEAPAPCCALGRHVPAGRGADGTFTSRGSCNRRRAERTSASTRRSTRPAHGNDPVPPSDRADSTVSSTPTSVAGRRVRGEARCCPTCTEDHRIRKRRRDETAS